MSNFFDYLWVLMYKSRGAISSTPHNFCRGRMLKKEKWAHRDSNPEPTDYESAALTVELWAQNNNKIS